MDGKNTVREEELSNFVLAQALLMTADVTLSVGVLENGRKSGYAPGHCSLSGQIPTSIGSSVRFNWPHITGESQQFLQTLTLSSHITKCGSPETYTSPLVTFEPQTVL